MNALSDWSLNGQRIVLRKRFRLGDRMIEEKGGHFTLFFEILPKSPFWPVYSALIAKDMHSH
ncbi:hypothetical protein AL536_01210 [Vibrio fluvialis]|jgi:hypothetical protein|uniref:Uncharacterized protein n=1 Tax=Vibrio fluvialis TaxID=676 RepID=A0ABN4KIV1_VIBFL|nr:hypothetical protein AL536_01210 [Vibrio fluvialis]EKO3964198.1 hypothetical protein [Vibrio fluvialis]EKO3981928.1 hypothetical protein [Vibrio fluvialis]EKO3995143.1 hypothetical protein [Vibrio fluvialis]EKO4000210.1 hypothetical protein [Vibrio fluvialis]